MKLLSHRTPATAVVACPDCGAVQRIPALDLGDLAECRRCGRTLERSADLSLTVALAWSTTVLLLLFPANIFPLMSASVPGRVHEATLASAISAVWSDGWPMMALMLGAFILVLPFVWAALRTLVLAIVHTDWRPRWLGPVFRIEQAIQLWAIPEVLVVAGFVVYMRTAAQTSGHVETGGWCLIAAGIISTIGRRIFTAETVWQEILPEREVPVGASPVSCEVCEMILPSSHEGEPCPRCRRRLRLRKTDSLSRTAALVVAGYVLYFPAYYYPMSYTLRMGSVRERTIMDGVRLLFQANFWYLAVIVIVASICIPFLKLVGMTWLIVSVHRRADTHMALKTRVYRAIHSIGRWSYVDPLIVALSIPLLSFSGFVSVHMDIAALPFALVVVVTMLAARTFDPRLLWDVAEGRT